MKHAFGLLQRWFFTGLLVWLPFIGTIYLFYVAFNILDGWVQPYLEWFFNRKIPGVGLALLIISTLAVGAAVSNFVGKKLVVLVEALIARIPAMNVVYRFIKDFSNTFLSREKGAFREVVAVRFPTDKTWAVGFVTGPVPPAIATVDHEEKVLVFIMQAFSPATGFLIAVPRHETIKLDMPVDEAIKLILTGGLVKSESSSSSNPALPSNHGEPEQLSTMSLSRK